MHSMATKDSSMTLEHIEDSKNVASPTVALQAGDSFQKSVIFDLEQEYHVSRKTYLVLFIMGLCWGTCTLANVGPATTYTYATAELGGSSIGSWVPNAGLFPLIGLQPLWGSFADRFGKKWFIVAGGVFGVVGNIVAATAKNIETVIGGQALNGTGASLLLLAIPASMEIVTAKTRPYAQACTGFFNSALAIVGLVEAGYFAKMSADGWRWVYYFDAIFFGISGLLIFIFYSPPPTRLRREHSKMSVVKSVDYIGILLLLIGVVGLVVSLTWGGNTYPWSSARVIALLVVGICFLVAFCLYETFGRKDGLIDHRFLVTRNFLLILSVAFVDGMLLYGVNAFFPIEASAIFTSDPVKVNVYLLPLNIFVIVGVVASGYILGKTKHYRIMLCTSLLLLSVFCGLLALATPSRIAMTLVFTGFIGLGVGVTTVIPILILTYSVPSHLLGTSSTILASTRALGGTVGITIFASIYGNHMAKNLASGVAHAAVAAGLPSTSVLDFLGALLNHVGDITAVPGVNTEVIHVATRAIANISAQSFKYVWIANMSIGLASTFLCLFLLPVAKMMNIHIESALEDSELRHKQQITSLP